MPQAKSAAQASGTAPKVHNVEIVNGSAAAPSKSSSDKDGAVNGKKTMVTGGNGSSETTKSKDRDSDRISPGLKTLAMTALAANIAQQKALITKKPDGIQISRSKHWKFISSYHGPWLQLPPELLTQLSYANEQSRPPLQIAPAIFSTVLQIRTLVEEATNLAVRAHNPASGPHGTAKISRERQFRMYELAVEKLAKAYALDEVAASVASMQSASAVEEVAGKVLERAKVRGEEPSRDARYVYFFCEKIPSRMLSESTSLIPLTELHHESPSSPHYLRTRAITRSLKGDFLPAIKDLTAAIQLVKTLTDHQSQSTTPPPKSKSPKSSFDISPDMESQCVFQRGGCYLTLAIRYTSRLTKAVHRGLTPGSEEFVQGESDARFLRTYARKAERDFLRFLAKVDYSPDVEREGGPLVVQLSTLFSREAEDHDTEAENEETGPLVHISLKSGGGEDETVPEAALTYHPLLPDALYSLLLARTLTMTPAQPSLSEALDAYREREKADLIRWAKTVARLQSICDGYPLFLPARSPARADWIELIRMSGQTLLSVPNWEAIVSSVPKQTFTSGHNPRKPSFSTPPNFRDLLLVPQTSKPAESPTPSSGQTKSDYPITTERAGIVSRFVDDVIFGEGIMWDLSVLNEETKGKKKKGKK